MILSCHMLFSFVSLSFKNSFKKIAFGKNEFGKRVD